MGRGDECGACGAPMSQGSLFCPRCGRRVQTPLLDLERLEPSPADARPVQRTVAEQRGAPFGGRSLAAVVAAVGLFAVAFVVLSGGGDNGRVAAPPTTAAITEPPATTAAAPASDAPTTIDAASVSTVVTHTPPGTTPPSIPGTVGMSLYLAAGRSVARIELDSGRTTIASQLFPRDVDVTSLVARGDQLVVTRETDAYVVDRALAEPPRVVQGVDGWNAQLAVDASSFLIVDHPSRIGEEMTARRVTIDGQTVSEWTLEAQGWPLGVLGNELVVQGGGQIYTVGAGVRRYTQGELIAAAGRWVLWRQCDDSLVCVVQVGDADRPDRFSIPAGIEPSPWGYLVSPDGATMVVDGGGGPPLLIDIASGATIAAIEVRTRPAWSADGAWLFTTFRQTLQAVSTRGDGMVVAIPLPEGDFGNRDLMLAVG